MKTQTMESKKFLVSLVAIFALAILTIASVSAFATIDSVEVAGVTDDGQTFASFAGETLPVRIIFHATETAEDVRVKAWITGNKELSVASERFDVLQNGTYSRLLSIQMPSDIDPAEKMSLVVSIENQEREADRQSVDLNVQRESYTVEILSIDVDSKVSAGQNLFLDVVVKNRGRHEAEDTFVKVRIPALAIERKIFLGDLSPEDQSDPDKQDALEGRVFLNIPGDAPSGVYTLEIEASNADSSTTVTRKVAVVGASDNSMVVSSTTGKTFAVGEEASYSLTLVNAGDKVRVYDMSVVTPSGLTVTVDEPVVAIPAGTSKTVKMTAKASREDSYTFSVLVNSNGELVRQTTFTANVEGSNKGTVFAGNTTVLLTVILAIIFVVLLVVLIVLLTRKPAKAEEFGESYY